MKTLPTRWLTAALAALSLAACDDGSDLTRERSLSFTANSAVAVLAPGASTTIDVNICPAIRTGAEQGQTYTAYQPGTYTLQLEDLPAGVTVAFPQGRTLRMPDPLLGPDGWNLQPPHPSAAATTDTRYCWAWPVTLTRDANAASSAAVAARLVLSIQRSNGAPAALDLDTRYPLPLGVTLSAGSSAGNSGGSNPPPLAGNSCSAGAAVAGRWEDGPQPPAFAGLSSVFAFALAQDRPLLGRAALLGSVQLDEWTGSNWLSHTLVPDGGVDGLVLAATGATAGTAPRRFAAWRATDYGRPREEQTALQLAERGEGDAQWSAPATLAKAFETEARSLQLAAWRGEAVLAWQRSDGIELRRGRPGSGLVPLPALPSSDATPASGVGRELRLAVDPVDDSLLLAQARVDTDGVQRLRVWRLLAPDAAWQALPERDAGPPSQTASLGGLALAARGGAVTLAWSYGMPYGGIGNRLTLTVLRHAAGQWSALGDTAALPDSTRGYALQPLGLTLAPSCSGGVFMAWSEPANYPEGQLLGAQYAASIGWDRFGAQPVASLPGGAGSYSARVLLATASDGRPVLAALMSPPSGGPAVAVLRRYVP